MLANKKERIGMANREHLKMLKDKRFDWNQWRKENKNILPDLSRANLYGTNLYGTNLSWADLREADLSHANLTGANLYGANLNEALQLHLFGESLPEGAF